MQITHGIRSVMRGEVPRYRLLLVVGIGLVLISIAWQVISALQATPHSEPVVAADKSSSAPTVSINTQADQPNTPNTAAQKPNRATQPEAWPAETFLVQAKEGRLVAYNMANGQPKFMLPKGLLSADGMHYFATLKADDLAYLIEINPNTGREVPLRMTLAGQWMVSGVSHTGRWVALTRLPSEDEKTAWTKANTWQTDVQVVDTSTGTVAHTLKLAGNYEVETISSGGDTLFLIEHLPALNPVEYRVRGLNLLDSKARPEVLNVKTPDEVMAGYAWEGVASPDGHWLLTLYLSTRRDAAFVHTLDLWNKFPVCIDLPSGSGEFNQLKYYSLAYRPSTTAYGEKLFATNAALGVVAEISLSSREVTRVVRFDPRTYAARVERNPQVQTARSLVSPDGWKVYFTSGQDVWLYDAKQNKVESFYLTDAPITALGLSGDGQRLYVASADQPRAVLDAATGSPLSFPKVTTTSMRGQ